MDNHVDNKAATVIDRLPLRSEMRRVEEDVGPDGGVITSSIVPEVQVIIPPGALKKERKIGIEVQVIDPRLVVETLGNLTAVSPVVIVQAGGLQFRLPITLIFPRPIAVNRRAAHLRVFYSIVGKVEWKDITESTLVVEDKYVTFTTTVGGRFWIVDMNSLEGTTETLTALYHKAVDVRPRRENNPARPYKQSRKLEYQIKLQLQPGYIPPNDLASALDLPDLLGASPSASAQPGFLEASPLVNSIPMAIMMTPAPPQQPGAAASITLGQPIIPMSSPQLNAAEVAPPSLIRASGQKRPREVYEADHE